MVLRFCSEEPRRLFSSKDTQPPHSQVTDMIGLEIVVIVMGLAPFGIPISSILFPVNQAFMTKLWFFFTRVPSDRILTFGCSTHDVDIVHNTDFFLHFIPTQQT